MSTLSFESLNSPPIAFGFERLIAPCMDAIYELSRCGCGVDNERKTRLVDIEYRARLVLERWRTGVAFRSIR